ncbi:hypothetical protein LTR17_004841 [Elasticomyces elasticus]|nr:hypothetical protein LTR17_004841 [Elasticomyces elasticus]
MADPVTIALRGASTAFTICEATYKLVQGIKKAPKDITRIATDLKGFYGILGALQGFIQTQRSALNKPGPAAYQLQNITSLIDDCVAAFREVQEKIQDFIALNGKVIGGLSKAFKWELFRKEDVHYLGEHLSYMKMGLNLALSSLTLLVVTNTHDDVLAIRREIGHLQNRLESSAPQGPATIDLPDNASFVSVLSCHSIGSTGSIVSSRRSIVHFVAETENLVDELDSPDRGLEHGVLRTEAEFEQLRMSLLQDYPAEWEAIRRCLEWKDWRDGNFKAALIRVYDGIYAVVLPTVSGTVSYVSPQAIQEFIEPGSISTFLATSELVGTRLDTRVCKVSSDDDESPGGGQEPLYGNPNVAGGMPGVEPESNHLRSLRASHFRLHEQVLRPNCETADVRVNNSISAIAYPRLYVACFDTDTINRVFILQLCWNEHFRCLLRSSTDFDLLRESLRRAHTGNAPLARFLGWNCWHAETAELLLQTVLVDHQSVWWSEQMQTFLALQNEDVELFVEWEERSAPDQQRTVGDSSK